MADSFVFPNEKLTYFLKKLNFFIRTKVKRDNVHSSLCLESQTLIYRQSRFTDTSYLRQYKIVMDSIVGFQEKYSKWPSGFFVCSLSARDDN